MQLKVTTEREQIEEAFKMGEESIPMNAKQYYQQKYGDEK